MALVAYDASSSEESESEEDATSSTVIIPNGATNKSTTNPPPTITPLQTSSITSDITPAENSDLSQGLFTALPQPKQGTAETIEEEDDEFLKKKAIPELPKPKKARQPVKIGIPALIDYESDEDEPKTKKVKPNVKATGLFALLPPPKQTPVTTKSFVPNVLTKKKPTPANNSTFGNNLTTNKPATNKSTTNKSTINNSTSNKSALLPTKVASTSKSTKSQETINSTTSKDDTDTDDSDADDIEIPETFDEETWQKVCGTKPARKPIIESSQAESSQSASTEMYQYPVEIAPEPVKPYTGLDNEGFKQLVGKMRKPENVQVIDIHEDDILPDKDKWMIKALTDPNQGPKHAVKDPVNDTCKRKHHITYLAQQAKANEQDLQNQWSSNRFSRKQTQSKYGF